MSHLDMKVIKALITTLRPLHWIKNFLIFVNPLFSQNLFMQEYTKKLLYGFICWCGISSSMYIFNDVVNIEEDKLHLFKKTRPIPSGILNVRLALIVSVFIGTVSIIIAFKLKLLFGCFILLYFFLNVVYSLFLKYVMILDVTCVALGFVLRVISGGELVDKSSSIFLIMCIFFLTFLLGISKRWEEIFGSVSREEKNIICYKPVKFNVSENFLSKLTYVLIFLTVTTYIMYVLFPQSMGGIGEKRLLYTVPFVIYGILKYVNILRKKKNVDYVSFVFRDLSIVLTLIVWLLLCIMIIYI